jgi:hypothetical protein
MVFASISGQFYRDMINRVRLSGLSHLDNFIVTENSCPLKGPFAKTKSGHIKVAISHHIIS